MPAPGISSSCRSRRVAPGTCGVTHPAPASRPPRPASGCWRSRRDRARAARRLDRDRPAARVRPVGAVRRQRRRADLLRRAAAAHARRRARRRGAGRGRRRLSGAAAQPARHAVHARRLLRRGARRDAGDHVRLDARHRRDLGGAGRRLRRRRRRRRDRLCARARAAPRTLDRRPAARRRDAQRVLLGAHPARAVLRRLRRRLPHAALADGRPRRQQLSAASSRRCRCCSSRSRSSPGWRAR